MWQGPTPEVEYIRERTHVTFRYWWDYSGGTMTDRLGRKLQWNPETEQFIGDDDANRWLGRELRKLWRYDAV